MPEQPETATTVNTRPPQNNNMKKQNFRLIGFFALWAFAWMTMPARAASVGAGGYTNDFSVQPTAADWSSFSIAGAAADGTTAAYIDGQVQTISAGSIVSQTVSDPTLPAAFNTLATWSSGAFYVQTRPTGNRATLLMCTLVNNLGVAANAVTLSYDFTPAAPNGDEISGHNAYYSLSGAVNSWVPIPSFSFATSAGKLTANLTLNWPSGSPLYILWADDNSVNSPDTANQIDNFSASATPASQTPAMITSQPQNQAVGELQPFSFTVGVSGNPAPAIQWYTNGVAIPGATSATYLIPNTPLHYHGLQFHAVAQNVVTNITYIAPSMAATLTVNADTTSPGAVRAISSPPTTVSVEFTEAVRADTANVAANYSITSVVGNLTVSSALLSAGGSNVVLTTSPQTLGASYTIILNNIRDISTASNAIAPNSTVTFSSVAFTPVDVGAPQPAGSVTASGNGYNISAGGLDIGGVSDQFTFNYQTLTGNFDVKVRLAGLSLADVWSKAGLMARETTAAGSAFAASLATPGSGGAFFESRPTTGAAATSAGYFPANFPNAWLRLQRNNTLFTGYASVDGSSWTPLGSMTAALGNTLLVGFAVSSHTNAAPSTAQFRDYGQVTGATVSTSPLPIEPPGSSSRKTPFAITEIMYKPRPATSSGGSLEFIEIYNSNPFFEEISNYKIRGEIDYTFAPNTFLQANQYIVIAANPAAVQSYYGISGVLGPWDGVGTNVSCSTNIVGNVTNVTCVTNIESGHHLNSSGTIKLINNSGGVVLEVPYLNDGGWPVAADGTGQSLVLARPSYGEGFPQAWRASDQPGGSPGRFDGYTFSPQRNVVINEFLANSQEPDVDFVELYNHSNVPVELMGCALSDDPATNKFVIATSTIIPARGFVVFLQTQLGFGLGASGDAIYFRGPGGAVLDAIKFEDQSQGISSGRYPDGAEDFYPLKGPTAGSSNTNILIRDVVINEIMYKPISGSSDDQFVELYNKGTNPVSLARWKFTSGIGFTFPSNAVIAPDGYVVIARNLTNFLAHYTNQNPGLNSTNVLGNFSGKLKAGERLALAMPELNLGSTTNYSTNGSVITTNVAMATNTLHVAIDEVTYGGGGAWGNWANEGGSSLELIDPRANHRLAHSWADSDETQKAPWTSIECTGNMDNGADSLIYLEAYLMGEGECLLDNVEMFAPPAGASVCTNGTFDGGLSTWVLRGDHSRSTWEPASGFPAGGPCLHVRGSARGDSIINRLRVPISSFSASGPCTIRYKVRWLRGWPELLVRTHGNYFDCVGRMSIPANLGTPGARNSRAISNAPPAIYEVRHDPVLPLASQGVVVTARRYDPDGVSSLAVRYRIDPASAPATYTYSTLSMTDDGLGGDAIANDGIYSATIPGQSANTLVAFQVVASDTRGAANLFPAQDTSYPRPFECLVRFGEPIPTTAFCTYRQWVTADNVNDWTVRQANSNERIYGTFVYGNFRAVYNMSVKWAGSPYHQFTGSPVTTAAHFSIELPADDMVLGTANFNKIHAPGNGPFGDSPLQSEQTCYWSARQLGLPWGYRRFVNMFFNGNRRGGTTAMMEDAQTPGSEMVSEFFPDDQDGDLFKLQPWFETQTESGTQTINFVNESWCTLLKFTTLSNNVPVYKNARYRNNFLVRAAHGTANDYSSVYSLIDAANSAPPSNSVLTAAMSNTADMEEWFRIFAIEHASGNWDSVGAQNAQNMYGYKPAHGRWTLMIWDWNIVLGASPNGSWGPGLNLFVVTPGNPGPADTTMQGFYLHPPFRRMYLRALKEICNGPWQAAQVGAVLDAKHRAILASGIIPSADPSGIKAFISQARSGILATVATEDAAAFKITGTNIINASSNLVTLTGEAPVEVRSIRINGIDYPVTWTSVKTWSIRLAVTAATNLLNLQAFDVHENALAGFNTNVTVNFAGTIPGPSGNVVFNELLYQPAVPNSSFVELLNVSTNTAFDMSGWFINGLDYSFPSGTIIAPRQFMVVTKSIPAFVSAFGSVAAPIGEFEGHLDADGETFTLIQPGTTNIPAVIVDKLRYENQSPWPVTQAGTDMSLQLIDGQQDNSRVSNWGVNRSPWSYVTYTGLIQSNGTSFLIYMPLAGGGDVYIDDLVLVTNTIPEAGPNLLQNGGFESPLAGTWAPLGNHATSVASSNFAHSGSSSLHVIASGSGGASSAIRQILAPFATNTICTLSFWFLPTTNGTALTMRTTPGSSFNPSLPYFNIQPRLLPNSPGAPNQLVGIRPAYDPLWLNEVQPNNLTGRADNHGEREPWIELYNAGPGTLDISGYYLANNYESNLTQWPFPAGTTIGAGEFKILWADGQPGQSAGTNLHTNFRLETGGGSLALVRLVSGQPQITDYLTYPAVGPDLSYGDFPDGQPFDRQTFFTVTSGAANSAQDVNVFINEWMASNQSFIADPADGNFDDWFELYNAGSSAVDLTDYYLTDNLANPKQYRIPAGYVIPSRGFLLVWADGDTSQNTTNRADLHVNFKLTGSGESIGLYGPNGVTPVDRLTFLDQTNNMSEGRFSDGAASRYYMTTPTPGAPNTIGLANNAPTIDAIPDRILRLGQTLNLTAVGHDTDFPAQTLSFTLDVFPAGAGISSGGAFSWTPSSAQAPSTNVITVHVGDNGAPPLGATTTFNVFVRLPPVVSISNNGSGQIAVGFDAIAGRTYRVEWKRHLDDPFWTQLGAPVTATSDTIVVHDNIGPDGQRFYRTIQID
ncbi:MAG: hypothetical protein QOF48_2062 [Verrucomicrobiota bacterium]|jgi:hypothetical protein